VLYHHQTRDHYSTPTDKCYHVHVGRQPDITSTCQHVQYVCVWCTQPLFDRLHVTHYCSSHHIHDALPGYTVHRQDRNRRGGGVAVYTRSDLAVTSIDISSPVEHCTVKVSFSNAASIIICCIYRPPSSNLPAWQTSLFTLLDTLTSYKLSIITLGDFNINLLSNASFSDSLKSNYHLVQTITEPTRITNHSATLIDHLYTSQKSIISECGVVNLHLSDHCAIFGTLARDTASVKHKERRFICCRSFRRLNEFKLGHDLAALPWSTMDMFDTMDDVISHFHSLLLSVWDKHAPVKRRPVSTRSQPWMTSDIITMLSSRDTAYRKYLRSKSAVLWLAYKQLRNSCTNAIRTAKRNFFITSATTKPHDFWHQVKICSGLGKTKASTSPWPCSTPAISKMSANSLNEHFISSVKTAVPLHNDSHGCTSIPAPAQCGFDFMPVNTAEVEHALNSAPLSGSIGSDNISGRMLRLSSGAASSIITKLFNTSLTLSEFPAAWKTAVVTPVFKKGCKYNMNNYRPIAILPLLSRIFERLLSKQLSAHLETNKLLSCYQHGFRAARSCQSALISLTNRLFSARSNNNYSAIASLDFSKAFDCLDHSILLRKLSDVGLSSRCVAWFRTYLLNRTQCVKYNNTLSDQLPVTSGVPQGSVFGPLLFNVYINDLLQSLPDGSCIAYADDVTLVTSGKTLNDVTLQLQKLLDHVSTWAKLNRLSFSYSKCNVMFFPISPRAPPIKSQTLSLNDKPLSAVDHMTILGVDISHDLSWTRQALKTCGKISGRLAVLRRLGGSMNVNARRQVFNGFVKSRMTYCLPVWGNTSVSSQHLFDKLLIKAARFILNDPNAQLDARVFESTGICSFKLHVLISNTTTVFNLLSSKAPDRFCHLNLLADTQARHSRATTGNKLEHTTHKRLRVTVYVLNRLP
jgi:hypothetical protein